MSTDHIRYDLLVQDALRSVVRNVLADAGRNGLPGDHHFYVSFKTGAPGVRISNRLREQYPDEMTIVLQHQFWDLGVTEHTFEVGLSFGNVPERLLVPFDAIVGFFDPSVQFGLKFEMAQPDTVAENDDAKGAAPPAGPPAVVAPLVPPAREGNLLAAPDKKRRKDGVREGVTITKGKAKDGAGKDGAGKEEAGEEPAPAGEAAAVVSLDAFRKKK